MTVAEADALLTKHGRAYKKSWYGVQVYKLTGPGLVECVREATAGAGAEWEADVEALTRALLTTQGRHMSLQQQAAAILKLLKG